jgi:hypothetical protein
MKVLRFTDIINKTEWRIPWTRCIGVTKSNEDFLVYIDGVGKISISSSDYIYITEALETINSKV